MIVKIYRIFKILLIFLILSIYVACNRQEAPREKKTNWNAPVPVTVAPIERGTIDSVRTFSGALEASRSITISSKIGGLIESVMVDIGDVVTQNQLMVEIDDAEYRQALEQSKADLLVADANLLEAKSALQISDKVLSRTRSLRERGVASEADLDEIQTERVSQEAKVAVYDAQVIRAKATLKKVKIQLGYAAVKAAWNNTETERVVAERFVDEGTVVRENTPLLRIVELSPINAVFYVPESVYGSLGVGQSVTVVTDAFPKSSFIGQIARIAPVFQDQTRQARVEVRIPNEEKQLKPGMFIRAQVKTDSAQNTYIVPTDAVVTRDDLQGVFVLPPKSQRVRWTTVVLGIAHGDKVEVQGERLNGQVVTLGQQLLEDGRVVSVSSPSAPKSEPQE